MSRPYCAARRREAAAVPPLAVSRSMKTPWSGSAACPIAPSLCIGMTASTHIRRTIPSWQRRAPVSATATRSRPSTYRPRRLSRLLQRAPLPAQPVVALADDRLHDALPAMRTAPPRRGAGSGTPIVVDHGITLAAPCPYRRDRAFPGVDAPQSSWRAAR